MKNKVFRYPIYAIIIFFLICLFPAAKQIAARMGAELLKSYTWDTPIYFAVGRGILNGIKPYVGLFETKPPGIFFLTAASLAINGDTDLCNIFSFICLIVLAAAPFILTIVLLKKKNCPLLLKVLLPISAGMIGILIMLYTQLRSGHIQVEAFGSSFLVLYLFVIVQMKPEKMKPYSASCFVAAFFVMASVMFKEPFLIVAVAAAMLFVNSFRDFLYRLLIPLLYGGIMGVVLLLLTGTLVPYLKNYLPYMTGSHVSIYGSPFRRGLQITKLLHDSGNFSALLQGTLLMLVAVVLCLHLSSIERKHSGPVVTVAQIIKIPVMIYLTSFAVGLGGQYYNHHYVFAVPFYIGLLFYLLKAFSDSLEEDSEDGTVGIVLQKIIPLIAVLCSVSFVLLPEYAPNQQMLAENDKIRIEAAYVDEMLDSLGEEQYQFIGFNGNCFYGLTLHSPLGPVFFQDPKALQTNDNWFAEQLKEQLEQANVLIVQKVDAGAMTDYINSTIKKDFTDEIPAGVPAPPEIFGYQIYFRK